MEDKVEHINYSVELKGIDFTTDFLSSADPYNHNDYSKGLCFWMFYNNIGFRFIIKKDK